MTNRRIAAALASLSLLVACDGGGSKPLGALGSAHPPTLEALAAEFHAAQAKGDAAALQALGDSVAPTTEHLRKVLREGPDTDAFLAAYRAKDFPPEGRLSLGRALFAPGEKDRTETKVYAATTEEIAAYREGTVAFDEFPGGMRRFARRVAAPGRTWYVVEHVAPGSSTGMKYSCFTRLGDRFLFLAKPWDAIPRSPDDDR